MTGATVVHGGGTVLPPGKIRVSGLSVFTDGGGLGL